LNGGVEGNMLENGKISPLQFLILVSVFTIGSSVLVAPSLLATFAKQDAWISSVVTLLAGLLLISLYISIMNIFPSLTIVECNEKVFGKWMGKIISIMFLYYIFELTALLLREIGDFLTTQVMPETPIQVIIIMFLLVSLVAVRLGLEVISRTGEIFIIWIFLLFLLLFFMLITQIDLSKLQPIMGEGLNPIMQGSLHYLGLPFLELIVFLMITPYVAKPNKIKRSFYLGTLIGGVVISLLIFLCIIILGPDITARSTYPTYILGKKISIGKFLERIEVIVAIIWFLTMFFKISICFYGLNLGLAQVFKLTNYRILLFPLSFILVPYSLFSVPNITYFHNYLAKTWTPYSMTFGLFLPLLLWVVGSFKKKRASKMNV
jgi:spore germination protein KB